MVMAKWGWQRAAAVGLLWLAVSLLAPVTARADGQGARAGGPVLVLGDSLSAEHNIPAGSGWVALLQRRLAREVKSPPAVVNASISGETTAGALARLPALLRKHQPSVLVVELGGNDALRGLAPAQLRGNLEKILLAADQAGLFNSYGALDSQLLWPRREAGGELSLSMGSAHFQRVFARADSGQLAILW